MESRDLPHVPFTTRDAARLGYSRAQLARLVELGELRRPFRGVYVPAMLPDDIQARCAAVRLVTNPCAVVCDRTAAWIWGVDALHVDELTILPPVESFVLRGRSRIRRLGCAGGVRDLSEDEDVVELFGLRVTTPLRTALDLSCRMARRDALSALDQFMRLHGITRGQLRRGLVRFFRRRGVVQGRELAELADPRAESPGESWVRLEAHDRGLEPPSPQLWVYENGEPLYRLDLAWRRRKVVAEYDGREFHGPDRREQDEARRDWLRRHGWTVVVFRAEDFSSPEALDLKMGELRSALR